jgi:hypothetical protein
MAHLSKLYLYLRGFREQLRVQGGFREQLRVQGGFREQLRVQGAAGAGGYSSGSAKTSRGMMQR